ncbi:MAG: hypothetical protein RL150_746, partial [Candidatus Parcubacteria bacterium]
LLEAFRRAGLMHIVVLSGFNVTIIAEAIRRLFHRLPPPSSLVLTIASIATFAVMTGASSTIVRASIMAVLAVIALRNDRTYNVNRALVVAGVLMIIQNPLVVLYDPGFQLSFVATLGLLHGVPLVLPYVCFLPERYGVQEIVATTVATQLTVLPLLAHMTGEISLISLLANVLVLPVVPIAMGLSALLMVVASLSVFVLPLTLLTSAVLSYIAKVALLASAVPFAVVAL